MSRLKVKLQDQVPARVIYIETAATIGATLGTDLFMPSGVVATPALLRDYLGVTSSADSAAPSAHRLLTGLTLGDDHPQYTRKDTLTTRGDLYARGATTVERLALGSPLKFFQAGALDPEWVTVSPVVTLGTDLSGSVTLTNLASGTLNSTIVANAVTDTKLRDSAALSVIGRSANSIGDPGDIVAGADGDVLRRSGTTVGFGLIPQASVTGLVASLAALAAPTYLTTANETALLANSRRVLAGTNVTFDDTAAGIRTINVSGGSPGGSTTQVQFNDAGAFGGDADFTWDKTTNTMSLGVAATPATINAPINTGGVGAVLNIIAGNSSNAGSAGGRLNINGGINATDGDGGLVQISSGAGNGTARVGGNLNLISGSGTAGNGGNVQILCGTGGGSTRVGGSFTAGGGIGGASGGSVTFNSGGCNGTGAAAVSGNVVFTTAIAGSVIGATGNITLTTGNAASNTGAGRVSGSINLTCGLSGGSGVPGSINLTAGSLSSTNAGGATLAGAVNITAGGGGPGTSGGAAGSVVIAAGAAGSAAGNGGSISLTATDAVSTGGIGARNGGNVTLTAGLAAAGGTAGALIVVNMTSTGAQTATFTATNKPGSGTTAPSLWLTIKVAGTNYYLPMWQ